MLAVIELCMKYSLFSAQFLFILGSVIALLLFGCLAFRVPVLIQSQILYQLSKVNFACLQILLEMHLLETRILL